MKYNTNSECFEDVVFFVNDVCCYGSVTVNGKISIGDDIDKNRYVVKDKKTALKNGQKIELNSFYYDPRSNPTAYIETGIIPVA